MENPGEPSDHNFVELDTVTPGTEDYVGAVGGSTTTFFAVQFRESFQNGAPGWIDELLGDHLGILGFMTELKINANNASTYLYNWTKRL